jgi:hypothetical protein
MGRASYILRRLQLHLDHTNEAETGLECAMYLLSVKPLFLLSFSVGFDLMKAHSINIEP